LPPLNDPFRRAPALHRGAARARPREIARGAGIASRGTMTDIPRWGRVTAQANEFLIQMRSGKVVRAGQGLSCFKWPSDSVAIVPTSIAKLVFSADQVTVEKVGVEVRGLAVYRIAEPLLAYRMIDLDRTSLTDVLRDMFVGATRRIVASLSLDACITHRKDQIASALMREIAPILAGEGSAEDTSAAGWGVVLDTIEIQDVRVLSAEVFHRLQAPYREKLALEALLAEERVAEERARLEGQRRRAAEQARRELMAEEEARIAAERKRAEDVRRHEDDLAAQRLEAELARARRRAEADRERAAIELAQRREAGEAEAELRRLERSAQDLTEARLREILLTQTMPELARAFRGSFDRVHLTTTNGAGDLFGFVSAGVDHVLAATRRPEARTAPDPKE
jgi:regulator of protease activity HflC (stomatin/prohibitin superfamily)